ESLGVVEAAIALLPVNQREVITLRDVLGWTSEEVCESLGISEGNQRVLLHRARSKVRAALEKHFAAGEAR
ncbi:MAG: RNA polymerase sigma factor, partial [Myxococcales bacterium]